MDSAGSDRPQRRTALVGREFDSYKVEIAVLSETRLAQEGLTKGLQKKCLPVLQFCVLSFSDPSRSLSPF